MHLAELTGALSRREVQVKSKPLISDSEYHTLSYEEKFPLGQRVACDAHVRKGAPGSSDPRTFSKDVRHYLMCVSLEVCAHISETHQEFARAWNSLVSPHCQVAIEVPGISQSVEHQASSCSTQIRNAAEAWHINVTISTMSPPFPCILLEAKMAWQGNKALRVGHVLYIEIIRAVLALQPIW